MIVQDLLKLKLYILKEFNQVEIFAHYFNVDESEIEFCLEHPSNKINNTLRKDEDPSLGFKTVIDKETGEYKIRMHDFGDPTYRGDCFDLVRIVLRLYDTRSTNFVTICKDIIYQMQNRKVVSTSIKGSLEIKERTVGKITVETRRWNTLDIDFWKSFGLFYSEINNQIHPIERAYYNDRLIYKYSIDDPCYHWITGYYKFETLHKLYFPKRSKKDKRGRFVTNNAYYALEGLHELRKADILIITKSYKDKTLLKKILKEISTIHTIEVTNFTAETIYIQPALLTALFNTYPNIIINTDFDKAGIMAVKIRKQYPIQYYFLTNGRFNTVDYKAKDITDYVKCFGYNKGVALVQQAYNDFVQNKMSNLNDDDYENS